MIKLKNYSKFLEDIAVNANDSTAQKMAKQSVNADAQYIKDYKAKKDTLTKLFTDIDANGEFKTNDVRLKEEIEKILGKNEQEEGADRNPLLQELTTVLDLQRQAATIQKTTNAEKTRMEEAGDEAVQEEGPRKDELNKRVSELKAKVTEGTNKIADLTKQSQEAKTNFDKKMAEFEKNLNQSTEQIKKTPLK